MLVLKRTDGQRTYLRHKVTGEEIVIAVAEIPRSWVKIGIAAADHWEILRHEIDPKRTNDPERVPTS